MTTVQIGLPDTTAQAARASKSGGKPMPMDEIQTKVNTIRRARRSGKRTSKRA